MKWANPDAVSEAVDSWTDAVNQCRTWGHTWKNIGAAESPDEGVYLITQRCTRCRADRKNEIDVNGFATPYVYVYPKNYLVKNLGRIDARGRARIRLGAIRNIKFRIINRKDEP